MKSITEVIEKVKDLNPTVSIKKANKGDAGAFVNLFNSHYKRKTTKAYFNWQFFDSPYTSALFVAFDCGELIGFYGVKIYPLTNNSYAGFAVDFLIDEPHRKKGIGFLLHEQVIKFCKENNTVCLTSLPNSFGNAAFKACGFKSIFKVDNLILNTVNVPKSCIDSLNITYQDTLLTGFKKDEIYRHWRYDCNPLYSYKKVELGVNCFAVTKIFIAPGSIESFCDIVDYCFENRNDAMRLIDRVIEVIAVQRIKFITIWALPHTQLYSHLIDKGFLKQAEERYFCVQPLDPEFENLTNIENWNLVEADAEIF